MKKPLPPPRGAPAEASPTSTLERRVRLARRAWRAYETGKRVADSRPARAAREAWALWRWLSRD